MPVVGLSCAAAGAPKEAGHITRVCDEAHRAKVRIRVECQKEATHAAGKAEKRYCAISTMLLLDLVRGRV